MLKLVGGGTVAGLALAGSSPVEGANPKRTLTIEGLGSRADYTFTVEGDLDKSTAMGASITSSDTVSGNTADGYVVDGRDSYTFTGMVTAWSGDYDHMNLFLNGERLQNVITIDDTTDDRTDYRMRVDGEVMKSPAMTASITSSDKISGRSKDTGIDSSIRNSEDMNGETVVDGYLLGGTDSYVYSGNVTDLNLGDTDCDVYVNGELVDPSEFERDTITFDGEGSSTRRDYSFSVEMDVAKTTAYGATIDSGDTIDGNDVSGYVVGGRDSYVYTGSVTAIDVPSSVTVLDNGTAVNPGSLLDSSRPDPSELPNTVTITSDKSGRTDYGFTVAGDSDVLPGEQANPSSGDRASNGYARGYVYNYGSDSFIFSGEIESISNFTTLQVDVDRPTQKIYCRNLEDGTSPAYEITVTGSISKHDTNNAATISGGTATGNVSGETDVFEFTGDVTDISFPSSMNVSVNYTFTRLADKCLQPNAPIEDVATYIAPNSGQNQMILSSEALEGTRELYIAENGPTQTDVPTDYVKLSELSGSGHLNIGWKDTETVEYWYEGARYEQRIEDGGIAYAPRMVADGVPPKSM